MTPSLCEMCRNMREVRTARSRFLLCELSVTTADYPKYPPQPVVQCAGFKPENVPAEPSGPPIEECEMNLSPVEAINRVNELVTVEMLVQRTKCCSGSRQVFLDSEPDHCDPKNLGVVVTESGRAKFSDAGIDDLTAHFNGKTIRVRGVVVRKKKGPCIEVTDVCQIEIVK